MLTTDEQESKQCVEILCNKINLEMYYKPQNNPMDPLVFIKFPTREVGFKSYRSALDFVSGYIEAVKY